MGQFLDIAETVLRRQLKPMKPRAIVGFAKDLNLFSDKLSGRTPHQTMKAKISVDIRRKGIKSRFVRTAPNTFYLRDLLADQARIYTASRQSPSGKGEIVIAFPGSLLDRVGRFQGINRKPDCYFRSLIRGDLSFALSRLEAEQSEDYKQLLTYVLVTRGKKLLCFRRGSFNRVEDYLRGSLCIGFGGHVSQQDVTLFNSSDYRQLVLDNAARELSEELYLPESEMRRLSDGKGLRIIGILNDDSSPTGRKHLAVVLQYRVSSTSRWTRPLRGEKSVTQLRWLNLHTLDTELREFEYWSQLCLSTFFSKAIRTQPSSLIRRKAPFRKKHLLLIVGSIGSGKSAATKVLTSDFGYREINSGNVLATLLGIPAIPETSREDFQKAAWQFINRQNGPRQLATALLVQVQKHGDSFLIDGIRQEATLTELRKKSPLPIAIIYVYTPPHVAFQFYSQRADQPLTIHDFLKLYDAPVEGEVKKMLSIADAVLYNWNGRTEYERVVRKLMRELKDDIGRI